MGGAAAAWREDKGVKHIQILEMFNVFLKIVFCLNRVPAGASDNPQRAFRMIFRGASEEIGLGP